MRRLLSTRWDLVVGSDLVYNEAGTHMLPRVMRAMALAGGRGGSYRPNTQVESGGAAASALDAPDLDPGPAAVIYYAHTKHRYDVCDIHFLEQCAAAGLAVEEVFEAGVEAPPPSPPPLTELFPEMRCAVFRITVRE